MANNSTNINITDNHLAPQAIEHTKNMKYCAGNPDHALGHWQNVAGLNPNFPSYYWISKSKWPHAINKPMTK